MLSQDGAAVRLDFTERDGSHPGSFESEGESADAGKEVEDTEGHRSTNAFVPKIGTRLMGLSASPACRASTESR